MDMDKIAGFIKAKRKALGYTQEQLAEKLMVTEKAISRWETGKGTPNISLLIPLSKELKIDVSENHDANKYNVLFRLVFLLYSLSILLFLIYLRFEYDPGAELDYFVGLFMVTVSSGLIVLGNMIYSNHYVEKIEDKNKVKKFSQGIVFVYYMILIFNMAVFARYHSIDSYNLIPFRTMIDIISNGGFYAIVINIVGNLVVFMPLEYFLIELFNVKRFWYNLALSFLMILMIEVLQFVCKVGVLDVDDLILCTSGMMLFYFIWAKVKR